MRTKRLEQVTRNMEQAKLDYLLITSPTSLYYLTDHWPWPGRRLLVLCLAADGTAFYMANRMFESSLHTELTVYFHEDWDCWPKAVTDHLSNGARVGLDREFSYEYAAAMIADRPDLSFVNGSPAVDSVRMVKDADELDLMRKASIMNDATMKQMVKRISGDLTEQQLSAFLGELSRRTGSDGCRGGIVSYGANAADPHHFPSPAKLTSGDCIVMDFGCPCRGYRSDMTRTIFWERVTPVMQNIYQAVLEANLAAIAAVRPGATFADVDRAGRSIIDKAGYSKEFIHRIGHSIGLDGHETPYVALNETTELQPGMVFSVEPGIYVPGMGGVRIEDLVAVTATGVEVFNHYPKDLIIVD